ncbi:hypothetical protein BKA70DRAFT_1474035 [Coprinopsis sp. MPI-PUGE-AT-0042]|nr:hypothetical protein BKA70DRAFT_1474035 [Coprinopsis sp. MPI-PUGE-AT-0042]
MFSNSPSQHQGIVADNWDAESEHYMNSFYIRSTLHGTPKPDDYVNQLDIMPVGQFGSPPTGSGPQKTNENAPLSPVPGGYAFIDAALASGAYPAPMEEEGYSPLPWPSAGMTQSSNGNSQWGTGCSVGNVSKPHPLSWDASNHGQLAAFEPYGYLGMSDSYHHYDTLNVLGFTGPDIGPLASSSSSICDTQSYCHQPESGLNMSLS